VNTTIGSRCVIDAIRSMRATVMMIAARAVIFTEPRMAAVRRGQVAEISPFSRKRG
jgi:hypothetical protein